MIDTKRYRPRNTGPKPPSGEDLEMLRELLPPEWENGYVCLLEENLYALKAQTLGINVQNIRLSQDPGDLLGNANKARVKAAPRLIAALDPRKLRRCLMQQLDRERIYLREDLTLSMLARTVNVEPHQLTCFLNHYLHTSFHGLINTYRVNAAKDCLIQDPHVTILDIAYQVGFNSKASFNRAFKKLTRLTPTQFRDRRTKPCCS